MQIKSIDNNYQQKNNLSFNAYYKNDSAGHLKRLYNETKNFNNLEKSIKLLNEKRPNHELEILDAKFIKGTEENPKVDWREATRSMWKYEVQNNENGHRIWVSTPAINNHLAQISKTLADFSDETFWRNKNEEEILFQKLVTPNDKTTNRMENPKTPTFMDKAKDFFKFWTKSNIN